MIKQCLPGYLQAKGEVFRVLTLLEIEEQDDEYLGFGASPQRAVIHGVRFTGMFSAFADSRDFLNFVLA